jgi:hypothetical protein
MPYRSYELSGTCKRDFDTEIKYSVASAKVDKVELLGLMLKLDDNESENSRLFFCVSKILSAMKKNGEIQFFVKPDEFMRGTTEARYILNKYSVYVSDVEGKICVYVKLP